MLFSFQVENPLLFNSLKEIERLFLFVIFRKIKTVMANLFGFGFILIASNCQETDPPYLDRTISTF